MARVQFFPNNVVPFGLKVVMAGRLDLLLDASGGEGRVEARVPRMRRAKRAGRSRWRGRKWRGWRRRERGGC